MTDLAVDIAGLRHVFGAGATARVVLDGLDLQVAHGEVVVVRGPSGSGKSTLLTLLGGVRRPHTGPTRVLGVDLASAAPRDLDAFRRQVRFVFQQFRLLDSLTALENVAVGALPGTRRAAADTAAAQMLRRFGLGERGRAWPRELSGGEQQRVAVARALMAEPRLLLADEPTASLDAANGARIVGLLRELSRERGCSVIIVTHDPALDRVADRVLELRDGRLVATQARLG